MVHKEAYVVLDIGTTLLKATWFDTSGRRLAGAWRELALHAPSPGIAEQSPKQIWSAAQHVLRESRRAAKHVTPRAISVTSERSTVFLADKRGTPLTPAITWMDQRVGAKARGLASRINGRVGLGKLDALRERDPDVLTDAQIHVPHSYLIQRLCGVHVTDVVNAMYLGASASGAYDGALLGELGIPVEQMPPARKGADVVGELTREAARAIGFPKGLPIVCGSGDQQCASLGLGVHEPGTIKTTTGTGTFVNAPVAEAPFEFFDRDLKLFCTPRATGDGAMLEAVLPGTGSVYRWARDEFFRPRTPFLDLDKAAARVPAGAQGVQFLPLFPFTLGSFQRLGFHATRGHLLRAILESSAYGSRFFVEVMHELGVRTTGSLRIDGGGARSPLWRAIIADVHRRPVAWPTDVEDAAARGAAILCALGLGTHQTPARAIEAMVRLRPALRPRAKQADAYDAEYSAWQSAFFTAAAGVDV